MRELILLYVFYLPPTNPFYEIVLRIHPLGETYDKNSFIQKSIDSVVFYILLNILLILRFEFKEANHFIMSFYSNNYT